MAGKRLLVIQAAALGYDFLKKEVGTSWNGLDFRPLESVFPAVTCTAQASFRTGLAPASHGMVANGFYDRTLRRPFFWEQSSALVEGPRIWEDFRRRGKRVAMMFWQQSLGEDADLVLSPAPIHKHHGGMIPVCYAKSADLYERLCAAVGREFSLAHYWGPIASAKSGDWIAEAAAAMLADDETRPDLSLVYLPTLDYDLQRRGPAHEHSERALQALLTQLQRLLDAASAAGCDVLVFGDYAMGAVTGDVVYPNRALAEAGLFRTRRVGHMLYPDFHDSRAFAVTDHEIAHVYVRDLRDVDAVSKCLRALAGLDQVLDRAAQKELALDHARSGELVLLAREGSWLAYPWWEKHREAPEFAKHVDIHQKPGFDPCELFFGRFPTQVSTDPSEIAGAHGRTGPGRSACWTSTCEFPGRPKTLLELARSVRDWLENVP
jgi:predicted AlkP superfamily pyrophosphatase or phosphodiesterase